VRDLRLLPAGVAAWLACALGVASGPQVLLVVAALTAVVVAVLVRLATRSAATVGATATTCLAGVAVVVVCCSTAAQLHVRAAGLLPALTADRATATVVGTVRAETAPVPSMWPGQDPRIRTVVAVERVTGRGRTGPAAAAVLVLGGDGWDVDYGARVAFTGRLAPSEPGDEVGAVIVAVGGATVITAPGVVDRTVRTIRRALMDVTDALPPDARGLVPGTAIGDTSRLPADLEQAMRDVSLTHVTAVSGAHFAVLTVAVLGLASLVRVPRRARALGAATVMAGFVLLVHPEPSVVRAAVMGSLAVTGMVLGRPSRAVPSLGAAVVLLLVLDPWLARSYGFVLSVLATGGIALLGPPIAARLGAVLPRWLAVGLAVPLAAQAACAPVLVLLQPGVGMYAVPANLLAAPALVPATVLGVAGAVVAPWWPTLAGLLVQGASLATWWIAAVARALAGLPGARVAWPSGTGGAVALAVVTTVGLVVALSVDRWSRGARRCAGVLGVVLLLVVAGVRGVTPLVPSDWEVAQCDVGQGDMLVVRSGESSAVVVDVGPSPPAADACLDRLGIRRIDLLVLTHHHADHVGGLSGALSGRRVELALVSPVGQPSASAEPALTMLAERGAAILVASVGGTLMDPAGASPAAGPPVRAGRAGQVHWTVMSPDAAAWSGAGERELSDSQVNDASVVVLLRSEAVAVLALGDAEMVAQESVARRLAATQVSAVDVVKIAHHGSSVQSERLVDLVRPAVALIGVGRDNDYGHPADQTVRLYRDAGAAVFSTHVCGTITVAPAGEREARGLRVSARCVTNGD